jgi:hypothetical protein
MRHDSDTEPQSQTNKRQGSQTGAKTAEHSVTRDFNKSFGFSSMKWIFFGLLYHQIDPSPVPGNQTGNMVLM